MMKSVISLFIISLSIASCNAYNEYGDYSDSKINNNDKLERFLLRSELIELYGTFWDAIFKGFTNGNTDDFEAVGPSIMTKDFRFKSSLVETGDWFEGRDAFIDNYIPAVINLCVGDDSDDDYDDDDDETVNSCEFAMQSMSSAFKLIRETEGLVTMEIGITNYLRGKEIIFEEFEERRIRFRKENGKWKLSQDENIGTSA